MLRKFPFIQILAVFAFTLFIQNCGTDSGSYPKWDRFPIKYWISSSVPEEFHSEIHEAFEEWDSITDEQLFKYEGIKEIGFDKISNSYHAFENVIFATEESGRLEGVYDDGIDAIARSVVRGTTKLRDCDIILFGVTGNYVTGREPYKDVYSVKTVMIHEIGFMLFGYVSPPGPDSVINEPVYPEGHELEKTTVSQSDIEYFHKVYYGE